MSRVFSAAYLFSWGVSDEVQQAGCCFLVEGCDGVVVLGSVTRYSAEVELRLRLGKPYLWLGRPEGWQFQRSGMFFRHEVRSGSGVTNVAEDQLLSSK